MSSPRRGEVYWVDFDPGRGSEQRGTRPGLVVQNNTGNAYSPTTVIVAISSAPLAKPYPFTVALAAGEAGLTRASFVNCSQLLTVSLDRLGMRLGSLSAERMTQVAAALRYELSI